MNWFLTTFTISAVVSYPYFCFSLSEVKTFLKPIYIWFQIRFYSKSIKWEDVPEVAHKEHWTMGFVSTHQDYHAGLPSLPAVVSLQSDSGHLPQNCSRRKPCLCFQCWRLAGKTGAFCLKTHKVYNMSHVFNKTCDNGNLNLSTFCFV